MIANANATAGRAGEASAHVLPPAVVTGLTAPLAAPGYVYAAAPTPHQAAVAHAAAAQADLLHRAYVHEATQQQQQLLQLNRAATGPGTRDQAIEIDSDNDAGVDDLPMEIGRSAPSPAKNGVGGEFPGPSVGQRLGVHRGGGRLGSGEGAMRTLPSLPSARTGRSPECRAAGGRVFDRGGERRSAGGFARLDLSVPLAFCLAALIVSQLMGGVSVGED